MKGQVSEMEDGKKKIWICLLIIVAAAVLIGLLYYFGAQDISGSEGFLIRVPCEEMSTGEIIDAV